MADASDTVFSKILDGVFPCHKVYEDEHVLAFLDIGPLSRGHVLVIPKERKAFLHELSDDQAAALGRVLPRLARAVMQATGASEYNILQNNGAHAHQAVFHVHFHIIPKPIEGGGLDLKWIVQRFDADDAKALAAEIATAVGQ